MLSQQLSQKGALLKLAQAENSVYDNGQHSDELELSFRLIESRAKELTTLAFEEVNDRMRVLDLELQELDAKVQMAVANSQDESELRSTISELEDEIHELHENDATPKLVKAQLYIAELEEDNRKLANMSQ
jgi:hypothetical protein